MSMATLPMSHKNIAELSTTVLIDAITIVDTIVNQTRNPINDDFDELKNAELKLEKDKCDLAKLELAFLGHIVTAPLHLLLRKDMPYIWTEPQQKVFEYLKICLTTASVLIYADFKQKFLLFTDRSYIRLEVVLVQLDDDNKEYIIAYNS
ncbi:10280_t:CDS:2 [Funneliformis geosporum]|uniref:10280_t:CDS:1 n=1 Tax=Funneliformis geosporum TaxID=1117311 RepID=A0A9W4SA35_9GLOM|nr:10280_t:CDS:2 [Funneliformis geosporum]